MAKVDLDSVEHQMLNAGIGQKEAQEVINSLKKELEDLKAMRDAEPKVEKIKYVVANTKGWTSGNIEDVPMTVVETHDEVRWCDVIDEIKAAGLEANNEVKKLKRDPLKNVFDVIERCPAKFFKSRKIRIVSKEVTQVLITDNKLQ